MNLIKVPNLPEGPAALVVVDERIGIGLEQVLKGLGIELIKTTRHQGVYDAISCHPDIMLHHLGGEHILYAPGTDSQVLRALEGYGFTLVSGSTPLAPGYPGDIAYNVARVGGVAFLNLKHTDPILLNELKRRDVEPVHINQGYAKCAVSIVDANSIITADQGIARAASGKGMEVLLIEAGENIRLPGLSSGFIGGCSGLIDRKSWMVSGDLSNLKSANIICDFLYKKDIKIISPKRVPIVDIGSIIPLLTK